MGADPSVRRIVFPKALREPLRRRESDALAAFFDAFFTPVYSLVLKLVGDVPLAEDLAQEVFVQIHQKVESYDAERELEPWVFTIATNLVRSHWRYASVRERASAEALHGDRAADEFESPALTPIEALGDLELRECVARAVRELPLEAREVVLLRAYEGLAFEDVASALEITEVAARKRYSRALGRLREVLSPLDDSPEVPRE